MRLQGKTENELRRKAMSSDNPTLNRLDDQIEWYDRKSIANQRWFKWLKIIQIVAAAIIPFMAGFKHITLPIDTAIVIGGLGVLIVILEGLQSLNQYQHNWTAYRSTCEELKHEKYLWEAKAGPYLEVASADALLAERVESLISREHAKWVSAREKAGKGLEKASNG
jgi:NADH:ubiquinone oxidoreductase subunit H